MAFKKYLSFACLSVILMGAVAGCGNRVVAGGEDTIQVRAFKGGYGDEWLKQAKIEFEKTFPGKKVEIVESSATVTEKSKQEILVPKKNNIDLYFTNGSGFYNIIEQSKKILKTSKEVLLEDLTDVYNSKAIGFDGKEESETIANRMFSGYKEACQYNGDLAQWQGNIYKLPWADAMTGLCVNKSVLDKYGLEIPLTTNDLVNCITTIASHTATDKVYPYTWAGSNASGYWSYLFETWFAQYSTAENFYKFMKCEPANGDIVNNGYEVYQDTGILKSLEVMFEILDLKYSPNGSASMTHMEAQNKFLRGESAFIVDGDWVMDEMKEDYYEEAKEIIFAKAPIISVFGEEMGITDAQLHNVVKAIDEGKTDAEIKAIVSLTDANIKRIRDARAIHNGIGVSHDMVIPSYSDAKDTAKLFIRFLYSNDGCRLFRNNAYSNLPLTYTIQEGDKNTPFQQSLDEIYKGESVMVSGAADLNSVRQATMMYMFNVSEWQHPNTYKSIMVDKNGAKAYSPEKIFQDEAKYMKSNWATYMNLL